MKHIKLILLFFSLCLLTGCSATYNLTVETDINEEIIISPAIDYKKAIPLNKTDYENTNAIEGKIDNIKYYNVTNNNNSTKYSGKFKYNEFTDSTACNEAFEKCEYIKTSEGASIISTTIGTGLFIGYPELDDLNINITVSGEVIKNNADSINGNTYSWKITPDNAKEKSIFLEFKNKSSNSGNSSSKTEEDEKEKQKNNLIYLIVLLGVLIALFVFLLLVQKNKYKK